MENGCQRTRAELDALKKEAIARCEEKLKDKGELLQEVLELRADGKFKEAFKRVKRYITIEDFRLKFNKCDTCEKSIGEHPSEKDLDAQREDRKR
eukprot:GDKH01015938.1.p2 GENE.GDKH01015938.1~~GDKH01015938.1.p2  ORF type:complete len:95 (+),score=15.51 GDKH01015938.1:168-452(+)